MLVEGPICGTTTVQMTGVTAVLQKYGTLTGGTTYQCGTGVYQCVVLSGLVALPLLLFSRLVALLFRRAALLFNSAVALTLLLLKGLTLLFISAALVLKRALLLMLKALPPALFKALLFWWTMHLRMCFSRVLATLNGMSQNLKKWIYEQMKEKTVSE